MGHLKIGAPRMRQTDTHSIVSSTICVDAQETEVWFRVARTSKIEPGAAPFLAVCLVPAMASGSAIEVDGRIPACMLSATESIQEIFHSWFPELQRIQVTAGVEQESGERSGVTGCFFSGGVDSLYTFLKHAQEIDTLVYVHGFDVPLHDSELREQVAGALREFAVMTGKNLMEVETNLRDFTDRYGSWGEKMHGAALAGIGLLLKSEMGRLYIPSSFGYGDLFPWGSHPLVDPLWGTDSIEIVHDGGEATRFEKVEKLAGDVRALSTLRVCWENRDGMYNCGKCEKCLRTMAALAVLGALERCPTFDVPLGLEALSEQELTDHVDYLYWKENYKMAVKNNRTEIAAALKQAVERRRIEVAVDALAVGFSDVVGARRWEDFVRDNREQLLMSLIRWRRGWVTSEVIKDNMKRLASRIGWGKRN